MPITWINERRRITELNPAPYNPRELTKKQAEDLAVSLERFSLADPVVINKNNTVIGGHQRIRLLQTKGVEVVDVRVPDRELSVDEERELNLRLNKNLGQWDFDALANFDVDVLKDVGFESQELDKIFHLRLVEDDFDAQRLYDSIKEPVTQLGDVYVLGDHRLLCGDATINAHYEALFGQDRARLIYTDPPYSVNYKSAAGMSYDSAKFGGTGGKIFNDDKTPEEAQVFYRDVLAMIYKWSTDDAALYWWFAHKMMHVNIVSWALAGWHFSQTIIWVKNAPMLKPGMDYLRCYEPCMFGWKKGNKHFKNRGLASLRDVVDVDQVGFPEILDVWFERRDNTQEYVHPTQKPVRLAERAVTKNSVAGDIVADLFGGSGSAMIACEQLGRKCYMMELDPKYCDVIVTRWEAFTGRKAVRHEGSTDKV